MVNHGKILQVLPELGSGGVERGTVEIARALQQSGSRALVASAGGPLVEDLKRCGAVHYQLPLASKNPLVMWDNIHRLKEILRREKVDIIHARSRAPAWSAYYAARALGVPFITTFHGVYNGYNSSLKYRYNSVMVKGERVIAVSNYIREHVVNIYKVPPEKIRVIHRGADVEYFHPDKVNGMRTMELCKEWHAPDGLPIILMPARLTRWKGQHILLEALQNLSHRNFFCVLLGEPGKHPTYVRDLERMVEQYKLQGHVRMAGTCKDMRDAYNAATVVVSPAIEPEAFGRVPVEAQAMGKPVIATAHGGAMETVVTGETGTGWLVPPGDAAALSRAIEQALHLTADDKVALAFNAREHILRHFSTHTMCEKVLNVYNEVMQERRLIPR